MRGTLKEGEEVLLVDRKGRKFLVQLRAGERFHSHDGIIDHSAVIGHLPGSVVTTTKDSLMLAMRPTLADRILEMPRGAQVIYPKDLGSILMYGDVWPGMSVFEAGVGSGALSMALLRAGASVTGYELRPDFAARARKNVAAALGRDVDFSVEERDAYEGIDGTRFERIMLDLPEPWRVIAHAEMALVSGGIFMAYLPSMDQVAKLREALSRSRFGLAGTYEVMQRGWYIEDRAVRPDHRMVAHTGFLTTARLLAGHLRSFRSLTFSPPR